MLNSAPVQLLPIDNGSGYKNKVAESVKTTESKEHFNNVFESVVKTEKSGLPEKNGKDVSRKKEGSRQMSEAESVKSRKTRKPESNEDEEVAAASARHEVKVKTAVEELKSGLSFEGAKGGTPVAEGDFLNVSKRFIQFDALALKASTVKKRSVRGGIKVAAETGLAGISLKGEVFGKNSESKKTVSNDAKTAKLSSKLSEAVESVKKTLEGGSSVKPSIELVNAAADRLAPSVLKTESKKSGLKSVKNAGKLRLTDHRQPQSVDSTKGLKTASAAESGSFKSAIDASGRDVELNPSADLLKSESRTAETRTVQSSVLSQLKETVNSQIVKQAGIIVKGNGTGEIKLVMKPENLGKVRIQLSLNDNHIAGRIIVENNIVKEIFESNLENLYKAFGSEGFENGGLEVSVQGQGGEADGKEGRKGRGFNGRVVKAIEEAVPELADSEWQNNAVNMVV